MTVAPLTVRLYIRVLVHRLWRLQLCAWAVGLFSALSIKLFAFFGWFFGAVRLKTTPSLLGVCATLTRSHSVVSPCEYSPSPEIKDQPSLGQSRCGGVCIETFTWCLSSSYLSSCAAGHCHRRSPEALHTADLAGTCGGHTSETHTAG